MGGDKPSKETGLDDDMGRVEDIVDDNGTEATGKGGEVYTMFAKEGGGVNDEAAGFRECCENSSTEAREGYRVTGEAEEQAEDTGRKVEAGGEVLTGETVGSTGISSFTS